MTQPKPCICRILDCRKLNHNTLKSYVNVSPGRVHVHVSCPRSIIFRIARMSTKSALSHLTHMSYPSSGNLNYFIVDIYTHPYIHTYIHTYIHVCIHTYTHILLLGFIFTIFHALAVSLRAILAFWWVAC